MLAPNKEAILIKARAVQEYRQRHPLTLDAGWEDWLYSIFPNQFSYPFAPKHKELWNWITAMGKDKPRPLVIVWDRGGGKSMNAEAALIWLGAHKVRRYFWYISETQAQADDHLENIEGMLSASQFIRAYPEASSRKLRRYGKVDAWRRNRLSTNLFTIDAMGLDSARRGFRMDNQRPDVMVFDDIDRETDTVETIRKKEQIITTRLLPAAANNAAILFVQNLVHSGGIIGRLVNGETDWLQNRMLSMYPAIEGLEVETIDGITRIVAGQPTWVGRDLEQCQAFVTEWGLEAFLRECQHVQGERDMIYLPEWFGHDPTQNLARISRWMAVDTAFKDKGHNDYTAYVIFDLLENYQLKFVSCHHERINSAYLPEFLEAHAVGGSVDNIIIEDKGSGITTIQTLRKASPLFANNIYEFRPIGSKKERDRKAAIWGARRGVIVTQDKLNQYPELFHVETGELFRPNAPHDDLRDSFTSGILFLENYLAEWWRIRTGAGK